MPNRPFDRCVELTAGKVVAVHPRYYTVEVQGPFGFAEARVVAAKAQAVNGMYWLPEVGELVVLAFIDGNVQQPVVLGSIYPPEAYDGVLQDKAGQPRDLHMLWSPKDAPDRFVRLRIDQDSGKVTLETSDDVEVTVDGAKTLNVTGNVTLNVDGTTHIRCDDIQLGDPALGGVITDKTMPVSLPSGVSTTPFSSKTVKARN